MQKAALTISDLLEIEGEKCVKAACASRPKFLF